ncbi:MULTISPECIES: CBS domain-containing protein [unclassified Chitinophaga]|uniref:CBS domain-containing protein n=1 Tax=unclassified Chitinophaga TaxID=2619133 RepID=UPI00300FB69E
MDSKNNFLYAIIGSIVIFSFLFITRINCPQLLDIDIKWIGVALLPLIFCLVIGKYIKKFSGFGIELEIVAEESILTNTSIIQLVHPIIAEEKGSTIGLQDYPVDQIAAVNVIRFRDNPNLLYNRYDVRRYLEFFYNVQYLQLTDNFGRLKSITRINRNRVLNTDQYPDGINNGIDIIKSFSKSDTVRIYVKAEQTAVDALKIMRENGIHFIPVVNSQLQLIGIVERNKLDEYLASIVISISDKKSK